MNDRQQIREAFRNMPRGKPTTAEMQADIYYAVVEQGVPVSTVAQDMGLHPNTVYKIVEKYRLADRHEAGRGERVKTEKILAGDKENGKFVCKSADVYEGTCKRANGKMARKAFRCSMKEAMEQWEDWCSKLRAMDAGQASHDEEPCVDVSDTCVDVSDRLPIRSGMTPSDVVEMLRADLGGAEKVCMDVVAWSCLLAYIEGLTLPVSVEGVRSDAPVDADMTDFVNDVCESDIPLYALSELRSDADVRVSRDAWNRLADRALDLATERADGLPEEMYVTWMADKGPHALFSDMETATKTVDTLNSALEFAGIDKRYEVMDVKPWRG